MTDNALTISQIDVTATTDYGAVMSDGRYDTKTYKNCIGSS